MDKMIEVFGLHKVFGRQTVVNDISFSVAKGEVLGFLGPNGAGKSTTMKMICGFLTPSKGYATVCGHNVLTDPVALKSSIGYLPEGAPAYSEMNVLDFLKFIAEIRGYTGAQAQAKIDAAIEKVNLQSVLYKTIETLSKGFKRRVGLAQAILHNPPVLIMDEPTDGLDPNQKHEVRELIREMAKDKAIIISTHILEEVPALCSRAIIIAEGKLLFDDTPEKLEARSEVHNAVTLRIEGEVPSATGSLLEQLDGVEKVSIYKEQDTRFVVYPKDGKNILHQVSQLARSQQWDLDELSVSQGQLDEVFRRITLGETDGASVSA
ncbi:Gliding motility-associated ABC transporter ATP-binding protein GldA [hydrothermal vent metagenome]|uniref:Gliding motility-associated ABC transporter ATP-binding protein GldA n=1 Tax=hydrothermal vent metagenome TaxID=652676 RepID=A0A3B0ZRZ7_9ZZZZ